MFYRSGHNFAISLKNIERWRPCRIKSTKRCCKIIEEKMKNNNNVFLIAIGYCSDVKLITNQKLLYDTHESDLKKLK